MVSHYDHLAITFVGQDKYQEAADCWSEAIKLDPLSGSHYSNRGRALLFLGKNEEALEDCKKAIELGYNAGYAYVNLGRAYAALQNYEEALINCNKAIELKPDSLCYCERGKVYEAMGDKENALKDFDVAFEKGENNGIQANSNYINKTMSHDRKSLLDQKGERED